MKMDAKTKKQIDEMSYYDMMALWRNAPCGHPFFQGDAGKYYGEVLKKKRSEITPFEQVKTSKDIGWKG